MTKFRRPDPPALAEARRALDQRTGPPTKEDRPKRRTRGARQIPGQLSIYDVTEAGQWTDETKEDE